MKIRPTTKLWKDGEAAIVAAADVDQWIAQGWSAEQPAGVALELSAAPPAPRKRRGTSRTGDEVEQVHGEVE